MQHNYTFETKEDLIPYTFPFVDGVKWLHDNENEKRIGDTYKRNNDDGTVTEVTIENSYLPKA